MPDNKELLQQLRLDKSPPKKTNRATWIWLALVLVVLVGLGFWLLPQLRQTETAPAKTAAPTIEKPAPAARPTAGQV